MFPTSLRDLAFVLFKWKWDISLVITIGLVGAVGYLLLIRDSYYETSAKLLVKMGQEQAPPTTMLEEQTLLLSQQPQHVNSEVGIFKSKDLLEHVVNKLGLDGPAQPVLVPEGFFNKTRYYVRKAKSVVSDAYESFQIAIGDKRALTRHEQAMMVMDGALQVRGIPESSVFEVTLLTPAPKGSADLLNAVIEEYLDFRVNVFRDRHSIDYFEKQVEQSMNRLTKADQALTDFKQEHNIHSLGEQETLLLASLEDTRQRMTEAKIRWNQAKIKLAHVKGEQDVSSIDFSVLGEFEDSSYIVTLILEHSVLTRERSKLLDGGSEAQVRKLDRQRESLASAIVKYVHAIETERRSRYDVLRELFEEQTQTLARINQIGNVWNEKTRALSISEKSYAFYESKYEEAVAVAAMQEQKIGNVVVIQYAVDPLQPLGPSRMKLFAAGLAFTLVAALAWAAVREYFDHKVYTESQLSRYSGAPVLSVIPRA